MTPLNLKIFLKDFLFHYIILFLLSTAYYLMLVYPATLKLSILLDWLKVLPFMSFYLIYCILFYHLFFKKILLHEKLKSLMIRFCLLTAGFYILEILSPGFYIFEILSHNIPTALQRDFNHITWFDIHSLFRFIIFTTYSLVYSFIKGFSWLRINKLQTEKENANASLQHLRSQIKPHFIFNSLNSVYALSLEEKAQKTSESIEELSSLFRYSLKESDSDLVPVQVEIDFIEKYIHLNEIRVSENQRIKATSTIFWDKKPAQIAPLLIIAFVENAFKYGISLKEASFIEIHIAVENGVFKLKARNSIHKEVTGSKNGLGLKNARRRLELLYKGNYFLEEKHDEIAHEVILNINLN